MTNHDALKSLLATHRLVPVQITPAMWTAMNETGLSNASRYHAVLTAAPDASALIQSVIEENERLQKRVTGLHVPATTPATSFNKAKTHCKNGHEFTPENTYITWGERRQCRLCRRARRLKLAAKTRASARAALLPAPPAKGDA